MFLRSSPIATTFVVALVATGCGADGRVACDPAIAEGE